MANSYLQFSFEIPDLTEPEREWLRNLLLQEENLESDDDEDAGDLARLLADPDCLGFQWSFQDGGLWVYAEEGGTPENVVGVVQAFLVKFRPGGTVSFEWAAWCSRPRLNEFGGGAVFVTASDVRWMSTASWLMTQTARESSDQQESERFTYVELSVLLDAVTHVKNLVAHGDKPWDEYSGDPDSLADPASETAYREAIGSVAEKLTSGLEAF